MSKDSSSPTIARVPWNALGGVIFLIVIFYVSQFFAGILISIYPGLKHWTDAQANSWLDNSVTAQFIYILLAESFAVGAIYLFLRRYKANFSLIGLRRPRWRDLGYGLMAAPLYYGLYFVAVGVVTHYVKGLNANQQQQIGFTNVHGSPQLIMTFISLVVLPPIAEEIMVRGFLYSTLRKALPMISAVLLTSAIFASAHLPEGGAAGPLWIAALDTFVLSLFLIYLREVTGSLWASIVLHATKNGIAFAALFALHVK
ncbi:MAG TPA: CPBP family intramembrane glutamic endopeptidase [Verrucomicrobiae bacterium]|nr:CPBP family intramembrane glutamic endopeptidase [Verrucomicrobiae bacterium]